MTSRLVTTLPLVVAVLGSIGMVAFPPPPRPVTPSVCWNVWRTVHVELPEHKDEFWSTATHRPRIRPCWG